jgi:hypothetical protein
VLPRIVGRPAGRGPGRPRPGPAVEDVVEFGRTPDGIDRLERDVGPGEARDHRSGNGFVVVHLAPLRTLHDADLEFDEFLREALVRGGFPGPEFDHLREDRRRTRLTPDGRVLYAPGSVLNDEVGVRRLHRSVRTHAYRINCSW